jgi:hypothetical protein
VPNTNYLDQKICQYYWGLTAYTAAATVYCALSTTTPAQTGSPNFTEPSGNAYARVATTNNTTNFVETTSVPTLGWQQANGTAITFPTATGLWGTVTYFGFYNAATGGNLLAFGQLTTAQTISSGGIPAFAIQALQILVN